MRSHYCTVIFTIIAVVFLCNSDAATKQGKIQQPSNPANVSPESAAREYIGNLESALSGLTYAMDDYDFDGIHWYLYKVYDCYARLDTLCGQKKRQSTGSELSIMTGDQVKTMRTQAFIDSFIIKMEQLNNANDTVKSKPRSFTVKNGIEARIDNGALTMIDPETALRKLLKAKRDSVSMIVLDAPEKESPRNFVAFTVEKLRGKTAEVHRSFDAGEFTVSRTELGWLIDYLSKVKKDIINHIAFSKDSNADSTSIGE